MISVKISEKILPHFHESWKRYGDPNILEVYEKGGRGSSKSTTISIRFIYNRMKYRTHGMCVRKVARTLRQSCREQIIWAIKHLEVEEYWHWSTTATGDMTITYMPTGTKIFFEGADGDKIKSWKTADHPTADIWFEEIAEYKLEEELSTIKNSILREELPEGLNYKFFHSYNPPKRKQSWVNKKCESVLLPNHVYVHHSDYRLNPFMSSMFIIEADHVKETSLRRYEWEYLGKPIGSGIVPFDNLEFREIADEEFNAFDNIRQGADWGYSVDPASWIQWHYDKTRNIIYAMREIYEVKLSNTKLAEKIKAFGYHRQETTADSSEPKSIDELKSLNCFFVGAKKGPGSVEYGEKWLDDLEAIVIDPKRTPNAAREFENIDYQTDKDGNPKPKLEDKDNHIIDATRYAFENDMQSGKEPQIRSLRRRG